MDWWWEPVVLLDRRRALLALSGVVLAGCGAGQDAVAQGQAFEFVSPGGKTEIFYDPPAERGRLGELSGESLTEPGRRISVSDDFAGMVVVLNIWGSWCGPCRAEMPHLQRVYEETKDSGVRFLGIDVRDEDRSAPQDFVKNLGITYPSLYDPPGRSLFALAGYPRNIVPSTIIVDRQHRVAAIFLKALLDTDLLPVVRRIAAEPAA